LAKQVAFFSRKMQIVHAKMLNVIAFEEKMPLFPLKIGKNRRKLVKIAENW
jgi:hypothetical protein